MLSLSVHGKRDRGMQMVSQALAAEWNNCPNWLLRHMGANVAVLKLYYGFYRSPTLHTHTWRHGSLAE